MKICTQCKIEKDESEFYFKNKAKNKRHGKCKLCSSISDKILYHKFHEYNLKRSAKWREENTDRCKKKDAEYKLKNKDKITAYRNSRRNEMRAYLKEHYKNNKDHYIAKVLKRSEIKRAALCPSRNDKVIKSFFQMADRLSLCLGIQFHVDHIIPLSKGGKHHETNLQVLPARINLAKHNNVHFTHPYIESLGITSEKIYKYYHEDTNSARQFY